MPVFHYEFEVSAPREAVAAFHRDTGVLRRLTPAYVRFHRVDPLAEGSVSEFTVWFGPFPITWVALHREVGPAGFTDVQSDGPLASWEHIHRFEAVAPNRTQITESIEYEYLAGWRGIYGRIFFGRPALRFLFWYRARQTRRALSE
ncbi:MAG: SRPBCC family protein [Acidimicrobiia bacterium]